MRFPDVVTLGDKYGPAMKITDPAEATAYFEACVEHMMRMTDKTREEAETTERGNLGYWAGSYGAETRRRVERLFSCAHPVFGAIGDGDGPSEEEVLAAGMAAGVAASGAST